MTKRIVPIPHSWPRHVRSALLQVCSLANWSIVYSRSMAADSKLQRVRLAGELDRARQEIALLREEIRIKDTRMGRIPARNRPFYPPTERMAILELKAARAWNLAQTAAAFQVEPETVSSWMQRVEDESLVQIPVPVNKFPAFVRHVVARLKVLCPAMGKKRIAETLARAGLALSATSVARFLKHKPPYNPPPDEKAVLDDHGHVVTARHPNHVWHVDMTTVPTGAGFWTSWFPHALPQVWPFSYWVALVVDHFSRKCLGFAVFLKEPTSVDVRAFLGRVIHAVGVPPKHVISDKGVQFHCKGFKAWCKRRKIRPRYGAVGKYGSIAIVERFIRSVKQEDTRVILVPFRPADFCNELAVYVAWYNEFRPHQSLGGRTPQDVYDGNDPPSPSGVHNSKLPELTLRVSYLRGRKHLPVVELRKAA